MVKLDATLKRRLKLVAAARGTDMSKITREAIRRYLDEEARDAEIERVLERMRGRAGEGLSTDEIMALTRGED